MNHANSYVFVCSDIMQIIDSILLLVPLSCWTIFPKLLRIEPIYLFKLSSSAYIVDLVEAAILLLWREIHELGYWCMSNWGDEPYQRSLLNLFINFIQTFSKTTPWYCPVDYFRKLFMTRHWHVIFPIINHHFKIMNFVI